MANKELRPERSAIEGVRIYSVLQSLRKLCVLMLTGFATSVPYVAGTIGMIVCGYVTDHVHERRWTYSSPASPPRSVCSLPACCRATSGRWPACRLRLSASNGMKTSFWPLPSTFVSRTAAAAAIAGINSLGNLGGLIAPNAVA